MSSRRPTVVALDTPNLGETVGDRPKAHATGSPAEWDTDPADIVTTERTDFAGLVTALAEVRGGPPWKNSRGRAFTGFGLRVG